MPNPVAAGFDDGGVGPGGCEVLASSGLAVRYFLASFANSSGSRPC